MSQMARTYFILFMGLAVLSGNAFGQTQTQGQSQSRAQNQKQGQPSKEESDEAQPDLSTVISRLDKIDARLTQMEKSIEQLQIISASPWKCSALCGGYVRNPNYNKPILEQVSVSSTGRTLDEAFLGLKSRCRNVRLFVGVDRSISGSPLIDATPANACR